MFFLRSDGYYFIVVVPGF